MAANVIVIGPTAAEMGKSISSWIQRATIDVADRALREEVARGFDSQPVVVTDGAPRRDYRQVKPFGKIEFIARSNMAEVVRWALTELQKRSPVLTGRYSSAHVVMINGAPVEGNIWAALRKLSPDDRVQILNPLPYARRIESATASKKTGREKRRAMSRQARAGVYRPVLAALIGRYGKSLFFDFKYVKLSSGLRVMGKSGGGKSAKRVLRDMVYPTLQFFQKPTITK